MCDSGQISTQCFIDAICMSSYQVNHSLILVLFRLLIDFSRKISRADIICIKKKKHKVQLSESICHYLKNQFNFIRKASVHSFEFQIITF